jgi:hypothetical protein
MRYKRRLIQPDVLICISQCIRIFTCIFPISGVCSFVSCDYRGTWDIKIKAAEKSMKIVCQDEKKKKKEKIFCFFHHEASCT